MKTWSTTQTLIALSSGEAELYGLVKAAPEGLGLQSLLADLGFEVTVTVKADASAALGIVGRVGLGNMRHLHTNHLWVQDKANNKAINFNKVAGQENSSDMMTKGVEGVLILKHPTELGLTFPNEKNEEGYGVHQLARSQKESSTEGGADNTRN